MSFLLKTHMFLVYKMFYRTLTFKPSQVTLTKRRLKVILKKQAIGNCINQVYMYEFENELNSFCCYYVLFTFIVNVLKKTILQSRFRAGIDHWLAHANNVVLMLY